MAAPMALMRALYVILALAALAGQMACFADEEAVPSEYARVTRNRQYVFVMLPADRSSGRLRAKYRASGLYRNDGSTKPLWTVDWYAFDVDVLSDGQHLVRWGPWPRSGDHYETLALAFYRNGREVKRYRVMDLVSDGDSLPHSESHYRWLRRKSFDDRGARVSVVTYARGDHEPGSRYVFDIRAGRLVSGELPAGTAGVTTNHRRPAPRRE